LRDSSRTRAKALKPRDAAVFASLADAYCAPATPFPSVRESDALAFAGELVEASPRVNRAGFRVILRLLDVAPLAGRYRARFTSLTRAQREEFLRRFDESRWFMLRVTGRLLKTLALMSYYGDANTLRATGYDPDAVLARGRAVRATEGRQ
jgi:hypothetical protein